MPDAAEAPELIACTAALNDEALESTLLELVASHASILAPDVVMAGALRNLATPLRSVVFHQLQRSSPSRPASRPPWCQARRLILDSGHGVDLLAACAGYGDTEDFVYHFQSFVGESPFPHRKRMNRCATVVDRWIRNARQADPEVRANANSDTIG